MKRYLFAFILTWIGVAAFGQAIHVVNTTTDTDDGNCNAAHCSLREAIMASNANIGPDSIIFNIPGVGPHVINVGNVLPAITDGFLVIQGTTQPGNNPMAGEIIIDGSALPGPNDHGLQLETDNIRIYGLQIQNFPGDGIQSGQAGVDFLSNINIGAPGRGNVIIGNAGNGVDLAVFQDVLIRSNHIGTDLQFNPGLGNGGNGLFTEFAMQSGSGQGVEIGGSSAEGNYVCSNEFSGLYIETTDNPLAPLGNVQITSNIIGTGPTRTEVLGNRGNSARRGGGIFSSAGVPLTYGAPGLENVLAYNFNGVKLDDTGVAARQTFNSNIWICNTNSGIDINGGNGNITTPFDVCFAPGGVLEGFADPFVQIDIFSADDAGCPGAPCQGTNYIGSTNADATGAWALAVGVPPGTFVTALAVDAQGNTSEFSPCTDYVDVTAVNDGPACDTSFGSIVIDVIIDGDATGATYSWTGPLGYTSNLKTDVGPTTGLYCCVVDFGDCQFDTVCTFVQYYPLSDTLIRDFCAGQSWTVNGTTYDEDNPVGQEVIQGGNRFGCDSTITFNLELNETILGSISADRFACAGDSIFAQFEILNSFGPYDVVYTDGVNPPDTLLDIFNGHTIGLVAEQDLYFEVIDITNELTICDPIIGTSDTVFISDMEVTGMVSDYNGYQVSCPGAADGEIIVNVTGAIGDLDYRWSNITLQGDMLFDLTDGPYSVTVTDESGCTAVWDTVMTAPEGPDPIYDVMRPSCDVASDGVLIIDTVINVVGTLTWSLDSVNFEQVGNFPFIIDTFTSGFKFLYLSDDGDCIVRERILIPAGDPSTVDLGGSVSITAGDSIQLDFVTDIENPLVMWSPAEFLSCSNCPEPYASPPTSQYFTASLINEEGCNASDSVLVQVFIPKRAFIPNVFSPNNDGINDRFTITTNEFGTGIASIIILNRGGVTVFNETNISLDESVAWDGTFEGKQLNPGVFTYLVKIEFSDGDIVPFSGTITLIR